MEGKMYRRSTSTVAVMFMTVAALASLAAAASAHPAYIDDRRPGDDPRSILWDGKQAAFERMMAAEALPPTAARASQDDYDVTFYDIDIAIDDGPETVSGSVTMRGKSLIDDLTTVILDLYDNMTVDSVAHDGSPASYAHNNDHLTVNLNTALQTGDDFEVKVVYHGAPVDDALNFSTHGGGNPIISSLSEPIGARQWWPCKDTPADKSDSARIAVTVDASLVAVSNGMLVDVAVNGTTKTYTWFESYPITTYLISVAVSNYSEFVDTYIYDSGTMPIEHYVYPEDYADALVDLSITPEAIAAMADIYGPYPFLEERYGHAEFPWGGAMEHETCTSYGAVLIRGDHFYDWVLVHELSHQWWGDKTTCATWDDVWLNEGFASYCEALFQESKGGFDAYRRTMISKEFANYPDVTYDPEALFDLRHVYDKGASILHMLRGVLRAEFGPEEGDARFFEILREHAERPGNKYGSASTEDFIRLAEETTGLDLHWFFGPWLYGTGRAELRYDWSMQSQGLGAQVELQLEQVQPDPVYPHGEPFPDTPAFFRMPWEIRFYFADGDSSSQIVWQEARSQIFQLDVSHPTDVGLVSLAVDPDHWVLRKLERGPGLDTSRLIVGISPAQAAPGPFEISYRVPAGLTLDLDIFDVSGRRVIQLLRGETKPGIDAFTWSGENENGQVVSSGVYYVRASSRGRENVERIVLVR
jgi:aminopeptidase N